MRGAEFSSSAKRSKSHRSSRVRDIRTLTLTNAGAVDAVPGADEAAGATLVAADSTVAGDGASDRAREMPVGEANVSRAPTSDTSAAQEQAMRQPPIPERSRPSSP